MSEPFWQTKTLAEMSDFEWEALCDGCGRCCLYKLEDEDTHELFFTQVACQLLDIESCRCTDYSRRHKKVPDCLNLRRGFTQFYWLPSTCAYRILNAGGQLPEWHPLITGRAESVHEAGISVRAFALPESAAGAPEDHVIEWLV